MKRRSGAGSKPMSKGFTRPVRAEEIPLGPVESDLPDHARRPANMCFAASRSGSCCRPPMRSTASIACCPRSHPLDFPVPQPLALCEDPDVIGAIFYVMELARGRPYANGALPDFDPPTRRRMYEQLIDTLADLHTIDPEAPGSAISASPAIISSGR